MGGDTATATMQSPSPAPISITPATPRSAKPGGMRITPPSEQNVQSAETLKERLRNTAVFSPVNQKGCFEFDRVIKSGEVLKRTRKTKHWKTTHIVLRPNKISLYSDRAETKLRHQISLPDLTAVARQKDPKGKAHYVFGLFTPSRNFHFSAKSEKDAQEWVELIRSEARIDEDEEEMILMSPKAERKMMDFPSQAGENCGRRSESGHMPMLSSSSEAEVPFPTGTSPQKGMRSAASFQRPKNQLPRRTSNSVAYSGNEYNSFSDFSDSGAPSGFRASSLSLSNPNPPTDQSSADSVYGNKPTQPGQPRTSSRTFQSQGDGATPLPQPANANLPANAASNSDRVIHHGYLYLLQKRTPSHLRSWKKVWAVLRPRHLALYKSRSEYSASLILPFNTIVDAVEIDPISRTKRWCLQVISEERGYRFCVCLDDKDGKVGDGTNGVGKPGKEKEGEEQLSRWLGGLKCLLARRREIEREHGKEKVGNNNNTQNQNQNQAGTASVSGKRNVSSGSTIAGGKNGDVETGQLGQGQQQHQQQEQPRESLQTLR